MDILERNTGRVMKAAIVYIVWKLMKEIRATSSSSLEESNM
jgi:hypothetical protein